MIGDQFLHSFIKFAGPFLKNLNPSLFQSVILGILAIFIPFAVAFFVDILHPKKAKRSDFEKMVLSDEVLGTKKIFRLTVIGMAFFAFFSGTDISIYVKIVSIFVFLILIFLFWGAFKKILRFSEGYKSEFKILFFKHLFFSRILKFKNKIKAEKMKLAWGYFWSEKSEFNERDFTKIFISHIDDAVIKYKKFGLAVELSHTYVENIEKRDVFSISEILPKVFEWNEIFWNEQHFLKSYNTEKRTQNLFSQKNFPTFRNWALKICKKAYSKRDPFWNWNYFGVEFFQAITKNLLKDVHGPYQLFSVFKKYVDESMEKLNKIKDEKEKQKYDSYITGLFASFCQTFFSEIDSALSNYDIWEHDFPNEWKISMANTKSGIPRVILHEFLQWSRDRMFKDDKKPDFDKILTEVINGIFPNIYSSLFTTFLMLFFSIEVKYAIEKKPNFYILGMSVSWIGSAEESEGGRDKRLAEMMNAKAVSQKEETISIILNFFSNHWNELKITLNDDNKDEWEKADNKKRESMLKIARKEKLGKIKTEIESDEIKKMCKDDERKELYRKEFLELVGLLLKEVEK